MNNEPPDGGRATGGLQSQPAPVAQGAHSDIQCEQSSSELIRFYASLDRLPKDRLHQLYLDAQRHFATQPNSSNRIRLAILLARPETGFTDEGRSRSLLHAAVRQPTQPSDVDEAIAFAQLLLTMLEDRARAEGQREQTEKTLLRERRMRETLQGQLDELKAIEHRLNERSQETPLRP